MLRIAVAGAGMVSTHHLRGWQECAGAQVIAIADPDLQRAQTRCTQFAVPAAYADAAEMLDREHPDALDIAAGHAAHGALCLLAADRGIAVLCQKPLACTLSEAQRIVAAINGRVRVMVHENWRFRPWYQQALHWVQEGTIGHVQQVALAMRSSGLVLRNGVRAALLRQPMLASIPRLMVGEILVHHLDVATSLAGAMTVMAAVLKHDVPEIPGETRARLTLRGQHATGIVSGDLVQADAPTIPTDTLQLLGDAGSVVLDSGTLTLRGRAQRTIHFDLTAGYQSSYSDAIAHFAQALVTGAAFATPPEAHMAVLRMAADAYRLAESR